LPAAETGIWCDLLFRWNVRTSVRESNSALVPVMDFMVGTGRNHCTLQASPNKRPSSTRPHDFRETERELGGSASKWGKEGGGQTPCWRPAMTRLKAQARLRAGRDALLGGHRAHHTHCGVETFDVVCSVEETGLGCELSPFSEVLFQNAANPLGVRLNGASAHSLFGRSSKLDFR